MVVGVFLVISVCFVPCCVVFAMYFKLHINIIYIYIYNDICAYMFSKNLLCSSCHVSSWDVVCVQFSIEQT